MDLLAWPKATELKSAVAFASIPAERQLPGFTPRVFHLPLVSSAPGGRMNNPSLPQRENEIYIKDDPS
jgi:hypothetical protein